MFDLEPPAQQVATLVRGVTDDQLSSPTPCESTEVRELLAHLLGLSAAFSAAAAKALGPMTQTAPGTVPLVLSSDWRSQFPRQLDELVAAWRNPDAWEGQTQAGGVTLPGAVAGQVALNELVIHGWDLARATGQPYEVDEASLDVSLAFLAESTDPADREGIFGPVVEVPAGAPAIDRAIGLSGRDPSWTANGR